jgi:5S rRNA maturation endonuclease (ribonuclease M5)/energy-coupling factor transporter ATP-binding protein EcfA2
MEDENRPFTISKVRISGFKKIRNPFELTFNDLVTILVGDNGVGKSTIVEAINLALSGKYRDAPISRSVSEYLFNKDDVALFTNSSQPYLAFPEVRIDVYLEGGDKATAARLSGAYCPEKTKKCGFSFTISFDSEYLPEVEEASRSEHFDSLPIEFFEASWTTFSGEKVTPRMLPITSVLINPNGDMRPSFGTDRATKSLIDTLDKDDRLALSQGARKGKDGFRQAVRNGEVNQKLARSASFKVGNPELDVNLGSADSWYRDLTISLSGVPYENIGAGPQCLLQSEISFGSISSGSSKPTVVLIEEPENHLSYGNLNRLLSLLSSYQGSQFLCTTHSSFVANKLGLENLVVIGSAMDGIPSTTLKHLPEATYSFFRKLPGFETLRLALVDKAILVEGPSDELIIQRAYQDKYGRSPLADGIDVISVGLAFERFLSIAQLIGKKVAIVTDNDGDPEKLARKFESYLPLGNIHAFFDSEAHDEPHDDYPTLRLDTLEATLVRSAGRETLCSLLGRKDESDHSLIHYMETNKTDTALSIFDSETSIVFPGYITGAIEWIGEN